MAPLADWAPLLKDLEQLHSLWLTKTDAATEDKEWSHAVLFGIETGWNRIAEEVAKPNPTIRKIIADWQHYLKGREEAAGQELVEGVDYGIALVIECILRFFENRIPQEPPRSRPGTASNVNQAEETR